jgi:uncharacterized OB-fold protein
MSDTALPGPIRQPEDSPFWEAAADERLLVRRCTDCKQTHWYPRALCPFCQGDTEWEEQDSRGSVYSYTIVPKSRTGPFAIGYIELPDGLRLYGAFARDSHDKLRIGAAAEVRFVTSADGTNLPIFVVLGDVSRGDDQSSSGEQT